MKIYITNTKTLFNSHRIILTCVFFAAVLSNIGCKKNGFSINDTEDISYNDLILWKSSYKKESLEDLF